MFESALKTNDALEFGVVTGCLRISKDHMDIVREWYDGYVFGENTIYNPWSVIKYAKDHIEAPQKFPESYWSNTSANSIIKDMIERADASVKDELDILISGGTIEKRVHEDITYDDIDKNDDNLWNFLFFTGYMKKVSERMEGDDIYMKMMVPNREIMSIYRNQIKAWFDETVKAVDFSALYKAIKEKDTDEIEEFVSNLLAKSISYFDSDETFYHGFFLSLMYGFSG